MAAGTPRADRPGPEAVSGVQPAWLCGAARVDAGCPVLWHYAVTRSHALLGSRERELPGPAYGPTMVSEGHLGRCTPRRRTAIATPMIHLHR